MSHEREAEPMSASTVRKSLVRATEDGELRWFFGGGLHIWKATADDTDGAFLLFEDRMDRGKVTPLHLHPDSDETMIVLEGEILMHLDGAEHTIRAGGIASAPRGIPHAFMVSGADGARLLCLHTPGCCQAFYWDASEPVPSDDRRGIDAGPLDMGRPRRTAASRSSVRPRSARSLRADLVSPPDSPSASSHGLSSM
jgi:mannose-6-phosphate isomerase-like protein (cupin superfamily)